MISRFGVRCTAKLNPNGLTLTSVLIVLIALTLYPAWVGDTAKPGEPSIPSAAYLTSTGRLVSLESRMVRRVRDLRALGFAGQRWEYSTEGEKSPVRIRAGDKIEFVVRLDKGLDPVEWIQFYRFDVVSGSRSIRVANFDALGRVSDPHPDIVEFNAAKYDASSFQLVPIRSLEPGEYCLLITRATEWPKTVPGFCFGIDASPQIGSVQATRPTQKEPETEPDYSSVFYYRASSGKLIELERQTPQVINKPGKALFALTGERSPVRLNEQGEMQFVVRVTEDLAQAIPTIQLFRFEVRDGRREMLTRKSQILSNKTTLEFQAERYGESSLKIVPTPKLTPGEYCLSRTTIRQGYCFGVDVTANP